MQPLATYPVIVVAPGKLSACRDFYTGLLGFDIVFEASWFVYLNTAGENPQGIAFMASDHPSHPPGPETFGGNGVFFTIQVADAAAEYERLKDFGASFAYAIQDEAWGQRRFALIDPAGTWVDIVEQIDPEPGFWDPYIAD